MPSIQEPRVDLGRVDSTALLAAVLADPAERQRFQEAMRTAQTEVQLPDDLAEIRRAADID